MGSLFGPSDPRLRPLGRSHHRAPKVRSGEHGLTLAG